LGFGIDTHQLLPRVNGLGWTWHWRALVAAPATTTKIEWPELGTDAHQVLVALVGGTDEVFFGETVVMVSTGSRVHIGSDRPANRVRISSLNLCQNEASFLKSHHKVKNESSSISKWCISNDKQRRATDVDFFGLCVSLRQVCLFCEQTGVFLSETECERFLDSDESVCYSVLQCQLKILEPKLLELTHKSGFLWKRPPAPVNHVKY